jgi:hypothetical protein
MPDNASATGEPARLTERVTLALESGDLDAIRDLLGTGARWGAPEGPHEADCQNRDQVVAWWASARAAGARAVVTEVTPPARGHFWWGLKSPAHRRLARRAEWRSAGRS